MLPQIKLAFLAAKYGPKLLHLNNPDLLTRDLGDAMKKQKDALSDPAKGTIFTAYDVLPLIAEVKVMTFITANKLGVAYMGRSDIEVLEDIVKAAEARNGGKYAKDIKSTLEWTRKLFAHPEIQDALGMQMTEITLPKNIRDVTKFIGQIINRSQDEINRLNEFLRTAKATDLFAEDKPADDAKPAPKRGRGGKGPSA